MMEASTTPAQRGKGRKECFGASEDQSPQEGSPTGLASYFRSQKEVTCGWGASERRPGGAAWELPGDYTPDRTRSLFLSDLCSHLGKQTLYNTTTAEEIKNSQGEPSNKQDIPVAKAACGSAWWQGGGTRAVLKCAHGNRRERCRRDGRLLGWHGCWGRGCFFGSPDHFRFGVIFEENKMLSALLDSGSFYGYYDVGLSTAGIGKLQRR